MPRRLVNNAEWLSKLGYLEFLRDVGKHFSVNAMVQKESVRERLHNRDQGISYTEFSYMLLQAYDFLHLRRERAVHGADGRFGSVRQHRRGDRPDPSQARPGGRGVRRDGAARHALRRSEDRQERRWLRLAHGGSHESVRVPSVLDQRAGRRSRLRSCVSSASWSARRSRRPRRRSVRRRTRRSAQRTLARHMTERLHGESERHRVEAAADALFGRGDVRALDAATLAEVAAEIPHTQHDVGALVDPGVSLVDLLPATSLAASRREAREFLASGAISVNGRARTRGSSADARRSAPGRPRALATRQTPVARVAMGRDAASSP